MKHFHVYDTCGEVLCVDAHTYEVIPGGSSALRLIDEYDATVALFNWSNVVCVREEEDDDDDVPSTPMPDYLQGVLN